MKKLLIALALILFPALAQAQCNGVFPNNTACGNITGSSNTPRAIPLNSFPANAPGGTAGQVQINAGGGLFGGLTNTQLTALCQQFSSSLSGCVPASGGSSTGLFLNQAGSFTAPDFRPVYNITLPPYNAVCNYGVKADIAMALGSTTATSASGWVAGDVGKYIAVQGAAAGGANLFTTIASLTDSTHVVLNAANASGGAISGEFAEYGTDDAPAINSALAAAVTGGIVYIPANKLCMVSQINYTNSAATILGEGINSALMPLQTAAYSTIHGHVLDATCSAFGSLENFRIGSFQTLAVAATAIYFSQCPGDSSNRIRMRNLYISGMYTGATFYDYGVPSWDCVSCDFFNYIPGAGNHGVAYLTATNAFNYTSAFATTTTGTISTSDISFFDSEFHKFGGTGADNWVIRLDNTTNISWFSGVINGGASAYIFTDGTVAHISFFNTTFENEGPATVTIPLNAFFKNSGTVTDLNDPGSSYGNSGAKFNPASTPTNLVTNAQ